MKGLYEMAIESLTCSEKDLHRIGFWGKRMLCKEVQWIGLGWKDGNGMNRSGKKLWKEKDFNGRVCNKSTLMESRAMFRAAMLRAKNIAIVWTGKGLGGKEVYGK